MGLEDDVLKMWVEDCATYSQIEEELSIGQSKITNILDKNGITDRKRPSVRKALKHSEEIVEEYKKGYTQDMLKEKFDVGYYTLKSILEGNNVELRNISESKHKINGLKVDLTWNENLGYILGVIEGDGSVYKAKRGTGMTWCIALHVKSKNFAQSFYNALEDIGLTPTFCQKGCSRNNKIYWYVLTSNKKFYDWYQKFDYTEIVNKSENIQKAFIRGFYESEGTYNKNNSNLYIGCGKDKDLIKVVERISNDLGFNTSLNSRIHDHSDSYASKPTEIFNITLLGGTEARSNFIEQIKPVIKNG